MLPFAETVLAWRLFRGMTQADLARAARIPRPNLSAIERGGRDVTLRTLRALAVALDVRPGVLVDGEAPNAAAPALNRAALERIAEAAARDKPLPNPREAALARGLRDAMSSRLSAAGSRSKHAPGRTADRAYFFLRSTEPQETIASLLDRTAGRLVPK